MDVEHAIRTRRTLKVFGTETVPVDVLRDLVELATWAPNHHLTNPWRFRILGLRSRARLEEAAGPEQAVKLRRAPSLICVTCIRTPDDPGVEREDLLATGSAIYALLLGAHARGLAAYWRTPGLFAHPGPRAALGLPDDEQFVGLVYIGPFRQDAEAPARAPLDTVLTVLD
ncbi:MAG TPA: nitroreductase [Pseudonocardiaceae bacterium]|nr:nitroreductase [Pseudonocardiaceae bacterium]